MEQHAISSRIRRHYKDLVGLSATLNGRFAEEDVHAFRVEVKKLRALLRLASYAHGSSAHLTLPSRLHRFYQLTGTIRNLQLQHKSLMTYAEIMHHRLPASSAGILSERINAAVMTAQQYMDKEQLFDEEEKLLALLPQKIGLSATKKFIHREMKPFRSLSHASFADVSIDSLASFVPLTGLAFTSVQGEEMLHSLRKSLKDLLYAWPHMEKRARRCIKPAGVTSKKEMAALATLLGAFRDCCLCLTLFRDEDFLFYSGQPAKPFLQAAAEAWLRDKKILLEKINKALLPANGVFERDSRNDDAFANIVSVPANTVAAGTNGKPAAARAKRNFAHLP